MLPVPFLENVNGCLRCHKSLSPLKTHPDTKQAGPREAEKLRGAWRDAETQRTAKEFTLVDREVSQEYLVGSSSASLLRTHPRGLPAAGLPYRPPSSTAMGSLGETPMGKEWVLESPRMLLLLGRVEGKRKKKMMVLFACLGCRVRKRIQHAPGWYII